MKKIASFAVSLSLVFSAIAQEAEKQEPAMEASVSPAVVHEDVQKKASINTPAAPVQAHTSTAESVTPSNTNESKFDVMTFASENTESIILAGGVLAYLLFIWFLNLASGVPAIAMLITKWLYYIIGFPVVLTFLMFRLLKGTGGSSHSHDQSEFFQDEDTATGGSNSESSIRTNQMNSSSIRINQMNSSDKEDVEIQYQSTSGNWTTVHVTAGNSDATIFNAMENLERTIPGRGNAVTGHIRAKGKKTGMIYDMRS
jgi:hypothetical protein